MMNRQRPKYCWVAALLASVSIFGCGRQGDSGGGDAEEEPETPGGVVDPEVRDVSGSFFIGDKATPASGYELWVVNQTDGSTMRTLLDEDGAFSLPIEDFAEGEVYAFHLVREHVLIGSVDFGPGAGVQSALVYGGGVGFSLGDVTVAKDDYGRIANGSVALLGAVGGGFALHDDEPGAFNDAPAPTGATYVSVESQLVVMDATKVLQSFYRAASNPNLYARDLADVSRIGILVALDDGDDWSRSYVSEAGRWLSTSRKPSNDDMDAAAAPYWQDSSYSLSPAPDAYNASVYPGELPSIGTMVTLKLKPAAAAQQSVSRALDAIIGMPPKVSSASADGGAPEAIDYESSTAVNGLTRPLCQTGKVIAEVTPPLDYVGASMSTKFDRVDVEIDYYGIASGKTVALTSKADDFADPYDAAYDASLNGLDATWNPATKRQRFVLTAADQAAASHTIELPAELFPNKIGNAALYRARLRIYYRSSTSALESATILWVEKACR